MKGRLADEQYKRAALPRPGRLLTGMADSLCGLGTAAFSISSQEFGYVTSEFVSVLEQKPVGGVRVDLDCGLRNQSGQ
jgi:hypothetical protein